MIKVSVLVPVYNVEKFIEVCVRSLMNQTLKEIEIICINDGSTDQSLSILRRLEKEDSRIKIISKENSGYGHSMNEGLDNANGKYIAIVESDDFAAPNMLENLYNAISDNNLDIVKSNFVEFTEDFERVNKNLDGLKYNQVLNIKECTKLFLATPSIWSSIYSADFLNKNNIRFNETPGASFQDVSFFLKTLLCVREIMFLEEAYLFYRQDNSSSSINSENKVFCIVDEFDEVYNFMRSKSINDGFYVKNLSKVEILSYIRVFDAMSDIFQYAYLLRIKQSYSERLDFINQELFTSLEREYYSDLSSSPINFMKKRMEYSDKWVRINNSLHFCKNGKVYFDGLVKLISNAESVLIYGAGTVGKQVFNILSQMDLVDNLNGFCVSKYDNNIKNLFEYPIYEIDGLNKNGVESLFLVASSEQFQFEILKQLKDQGHQNVISMNSEVLTLFNKLL